MDSKCGFRIWTNKAENVFFKGEVQQIPTHKSHITNPDFQKVS